MIYLYHGTDEGVSLARVLSASMTCCAKSEALNVRFDGVRRNMDQSLRPPVPAAEPRLAAKNEVAGLLKGASGGFERSFVFQSLSRRGGAMRAQRSRLG